MQNRHLIRYKRNGNVDLSGTVSAALASTSNNPSAAYLSLADGIGSELVYSEQSSGRYIPRDPGAFIHYPANYRIPVARLRNQHEALLAHCRKLARLNQSGGNSSGGSAPDGGSSVSVPDPVGSSGGPVGSPEPHSGPEPGNYPDPEPTPDPEPENVSAPTVGMNMLAWIESVQAWQESEGLEPWGYRQAKAAARMLRQGFSERAIKHALTMTFPKHARDILGVRDYDATEHKPEDRIPGMLPQLPYVRDLQAIGQNICLIGPAGGGKTTLFESLAQMDGVHYVVVSCNPETAGPEIFGVQTPGGKQDFILSALTEALLMAEQGKKVRILLDEADGMDAAMALVFNRALEQRKLSHRFLARDIDFGMNVEWWAAMNTLGTGANSTYTGRDRQDGAFMSRFEAGRVIVNPCRDIQRGIFESELAGE